MAIRLYDSLTRELRELQPAQPDGVFRLYCCGPTVYGPAHIGNFRTFLINDVLRRLLELEFGPDKVKHVRNITDVDDRTIARPRARSVRWPRSPGTGPTSSMPIARRSTACRRTSSRRPPGISASRSR